MRHFAKILLWTVLSSTALAGCAAPASPAQLAIAYRQMFNSALQSIHALHEQGKLSADDERKLLPVILAGSAALDQMDADAAADNQSGLDAATAAAQSALAQIQSVAHLSTTQGSSRSK